MYVNSLHSDNQINKPFVRGAVIFVPFTLQFLLAAPLLWGKKGAINYVVET